MQLNLGDILTARGLRHFARDARAATSIEYALIACGVSIAIITAVTAVGSTMMTIFYDKLLNLF
jgi:Flp pilus assembly pilin Flp